MIEPAAVPPWKFWHPLPFWKVVVTFVLANLVVTFVWVLLRHLLGVTFLPEWTIGGLGGLLGFAIVAAWRNRTL